MEKTGWRTLDEEAGMNDGIRVGATLLFGMVGLPT